MKRMLALLGVVMVSGCAATSTPEQPSPIGMANPAARYCSDQGGKLIPVETVQGQRNDCLLPSGERLDEWALYRRAHPQR
ncbi:DUF333 domain-containing protein [Edwardsiella tarda]|uniref:putative hemolysin n=1 Tax=Edwardsiella tarda TaxID=636 RepID=UPI000D51AC06|nr:DUF333 domain-containing protein [Edwardsiella tarda]UCQ10314.1 DUF333 domain-containing protein [Edwardsiella tarda]UCQ53165.1 DUF333 domain-containing protein [Edwardsiella tarda]